MQSVKKDKTHRISGENIGKKKRKYRWVLITFVAIVAAFLYAILLPIILKGITSLKFFNGVTLFWITDDISQWFAFYGSYSGVFVSIILTIITSRLTVKIEDSNQKNVMLQNISTLIMNVPYMSCDEVRLYSQSQHDILDTYIDLDSEKQEYMINIEMDPSFPSYFQVAVQRVEIFVPNLVTGEKNSIALDLMEKEYEIFSSKKFRLYINIPKLANGILKQLYYMDLVAPVDSPAIKSLCNMNIYVRLSNTLYLKEDSVENKPLVLKMSFDLQNEGKNKKDRHCYKKLTVVKMQMERIE